MYLLLCQGNGEKLSVALDVLSDMLLDASFDAGELEKERSVILEEIAMTEDSPEDLAHELLAAPRWTAIRWHGPSWVRRR